MRATFSGWGWISQSCFNSAPVVSRILSPPLGPQRWTSFKFSGCLFLSLSPSFTSSHTSSSSAVMASVSSRERDVHRRGERGRGTKIALRVTNLFSLPVEIGVCCHAICRGKQDCAFASMSHLCAGAHEMERLNNCHS